MHINDLISTGTYEEDVEKIRSFLARRGEADFLMLWLHLKGLCPKKYYWSLTPPSPRLPELAQLCRPNDPQYQHLLRAAGSVMRGAVSASLSGWSWWQLK